jgi:ankyrin repeat protein
MQIVKDKNYEAFKQHFTHKPELLETLIDHRGNTVMHFIFFYDFFKAYHLIKERWPQVWETLINKPNFKGRTPLFFGLASNEESKRKVVKDALERAIILTNVQEHNGGTPLMVASVSNVPDSIIALLFERGADPRLKTKQGHNVFHIAAMKNVDAQRIEVLIRLCKKHNWNVRQLLNDKDGDGKTPLFYAQKNNNQTVIKIMEREGSSVWQRVFKLFNSQ